MCSSAYHRSFGIPELYEEILLLVDLPTLLTSAQRSAVYGIGSSKILVLSRELSSSRLQRSGLNQRKDV
jgi:hypothetical protein